nr:EOG090X028J [Eulimnadia texana]
MNHKYRQCPKTGNYILIPRQIPPQNIVLRLREREVCGCRRPGTHVHIARTFHQSIVPNLTIVNVEKPPCFLRKFTPDGKYFIAFSSEQTSLEVYEYLGPSAAEDLLQGFNGEQLGNVNENDSRITQQVFNRFFRLKHLINITSTGEQLNRECSLFTSDGRFVIVGSASVVPEDSNADFFETYRNNESVSPHPRSPLENYSLHIVDVISGRLCDARNFRVDKIFLSHNQGLCLYNDTLAVLSVQHQTIHIFHITNEGYFVDSRCIGRFCFDDDEMHVPREARPFREATINSLKHRFLVFLYRRAQEKGVTEVRRFYQNFDHFRSLRLWKMQLLNETYLFLKYANEDVVTLRAPNPTRSLRFSSSTTWRHPRSNTQLYTECQFSCSPSNNVYARLSHERFKQTIISARFGGKTEATKRLLAQLPISAQSYSSSPYLDLQLFSYDDKDSGLLRFKIHAGIAGRPPPPPNARRLVAFTFHPTDPFAISVQRTNSEYVVNFHVRHAPS